ncbi:hypothetical protein H634G_10696 [Metarhizium anisopliae BRIP 53293]|uniref:Uncharacterized protein n=1 Tax=Metarhizium anisopliae BRIP 53293 TaxID=1291518 RepID=A0A0D9NN66_METAN|nr:hypothetical protein H634G_10696 [Metarhizium anisopliae BRIP 53293]KJK91524.1 hypothetical protein H633G_04622 [Metarhizium anisopliae BRIP 53284]
MELPRITGFLWFYLTLLLAFGQVLTAQGGKKWQLKAEPEIPEDGLQIKLDRDLYTHQGSIVYTSHLQFDEKPEISDSQLYDIARDAFIEMQKSAEANGLTKKIPNVMTTLLVGNELIFGSSAKGPNSPYDRDSQVQGDLKVCEDENEGKLHKNGGRCGEVIAFHTWYESHVRSGKLQPGEGTKIVAISSQKNADGKDEPSILAPCGNNEQWGCREFVNGIYVLDSGKVDADKAANPERAPFDYKTLIKNKKLTPALTRPDLPPPNPLPPPPRPNTNPGGSDGGPPFNPLSPPGGKPKPKPKTNPGGSNGGPPFNPLSPPGDGNPDTNPGEGTDNQGGDGKPVKPRPTRKPKPPKRP